jgi:hypothetical protein
MSSVSFFLGSLVFKYSITRSTVLRRQIIVSYVSFFFEMGRPPTVTVLYYELRTGKHQLAQRH